MKEGTSLEVDLTAREGTRWEQRPQRQSASLRRERSGNYLALGIGLLLPALIVFTAVRAVRAESWSALLPQRIELQPPNAERPEVAAEPEAPEEPRTDPDRTAIDDPPGAGQGGAAGPATTVVAAPTIDPTPPTGLEAGAEPVTNERPRSVAPVTAEVPGSPSATVGPTTNTTIPTSTSSTTTTTSTPFTSTPITSEPPTTPPVRDDPALFARRIDIGELGSTFVRYRFTSAVNTQYSAMLLRDGQVAATVSGEAAAGESVDERFDDLEPGIEYGLSVQLGEGASGQSVTVPFRTAGTVVATSATPVELLDLRVAAVEPTRLELHYESNICANGSFTIRTEAGEVVGRNDGQAEGCTTRHLAIPGFWTAPLTPGETYLVTVTVEADGQGRGGGNVATASITVTTA